MSRKRDDWVPAPKQKCPKGHSIMEKEEGIFYVREYERADIVYADSVYLQKIRNLLALYDEVDEYGLENINAAKFCESRNISKSNFIRLMALIREFLGEENNISVEYTPTNKKYLTILDLHRDLQEYGVDKQKFCAENKISRTTFFRYIAVIENFLYKEHSNLAIAIDENGDYHIKWLGYF